MNYGSVFIITSLPPPNKMSSRPPGNVTNQKSVLITAVPQTEAAVVVAAEGGVGERGVLKQTTRSGTSFLKSP